MHGSMLADAAKQLMNEGFAHLPYDGQYGHDVGELLAEICKKHSEDELQRWTFCVEKRPDGKYEPDDGMLLRTNEKGKDTKIAFHARPSLPQLLKVEGVYPKPGSLRMRLLASALNLYREHKKLLRGLAVALDEYNSTSNFPFSFVEEFDKASKPGRAPTARPAVRALYYPKQRNSRVTVPHYDRNALTMHIGSTNGKFIGFFQNQNSVHEVDISPQDGQVLVFWGYKMELFAREFGLTVNALAHTAYTTPGTDRRAAVSFWHVDRELWDAPKPEFL